MKLILVGELLFGGKSVGQFVSEQTSMAWDPLELQGDIGRKC